MEIFELRYFLGVAASENVHEAAAKLNVSPGSISKAVRRLEDELSVRLFTRAGRGLRITDHGRLLQKKAAEIVTLEESARLLLAGHRGTLKVAFAGPEILLAEMGLSHAQKLLKKYADSQFEFVHADDAEALQKVKRREVQLALVTADVPAALELSTVTVSETIFHTYCGAAHPLHKQAKRTLPVEEVLEHVFASPSHPLLGQVGAKQSLDGWRDDKFPRKVAYFTSSLKLLEELALMGRAVVYLPDYYGDRLGLTRLKMSGCPYTCVQKVKLVANRPGDSAWMNEFF